MRINLLVVGGFFFLSAGLIALVVSVVRDVPSGLIVDTGSLGGATLGCLFAILVGALLIRAGTKRGRFSKHTR